MLLARSWAAGSASAAAAAALALLAAGCPQPHGTDAGGADASEDGGLTGGCLLDKDCTDFNLCTDDRCDTVTGTCSFTVDDTNEVPQAAPADCRREICQGGALVSVNYDLEIPFPASFIDCRAEVCMNGAVAVVNSTTESPLSDNDPCTADTCVGGMPDYSVVPDGTGCDTDGTVATNEVCAAGVCLPSQCGDGVVDAVLGETCDPGPAVAGDRCSNLCTMPPSLVGTQDLAAAPPPAVVVAASPGEGLGGAGALAAGDVDGDGTADVLAGAPGAGALYVVLGTAAAVGGWPASRDLLAAPADVTLIGPAGAGFPSAVAAGDVNGDGLADIVVGAAGADGGAGAASGAVWVVYGRDFAAPGATTAFDLGAGDADLSFTPIGAGDALGAALAVGDVTGDGAGDLVLGAPGGDGLGGLVPDAGDVYVFAGGTGVFAPGASVSVLLADALFYGDAGDALGTALAAGNVGGSAASDVIAGAPGHDGQSGTLSGAGAVGVFYGAPFSLAGVSLAAADAVVHGGGAGDALGAAVATADFNGDGAGDLLYGAPQGDGFNDATPDDGDAYTFWGPVDPGAYVATTVVLPEFTGGGAELYGEGEDFGAALATGDLNDDGHADVVVSDRLACSAAPSPCAAEAGETYVVLGRPFTSGPGVGGQTRFQVALGTVGVLIRGAAAADHLGTSVVVADVDGNGLADIIAGVPGADPAGGARVDGGEIVVFFGGANPTPP
jgi:cysteine-rich repeat protein